jgi:3-methyladenine DNA glycosylase/8-oxoguanine DNA glycosylase
MSEKIISIDGLPFGEQERLNAQLNEALKHKFDIEQHLQKVFEHVQNLNNAHVLVLQVMEELIKAGAQMPPDGTESSIILPH